MSMPMPTSACRPVLGAEAERGASDADGVVDAVGPAGAQAAVTVLSMLIPTSACGPVPSAEAERDASDGDDAVDAACGPVPSAEAERDASDADDLVDYAGPVGRPTQNLRNSRNRALACISGTIRAVAQSSLKYLQHHNQREEYYAGALWLLSAYGLNPLPVLRIFLYWEAS